jgi:hypothetical protein
VEEATDDVKGTTTSSTRRVCSEDGGTGFLGNIASFTPKTENY